MKQDSTTLILRTFVEKLNRMVFLKSTDDMLLPELLSHP